MTPPGFTAPPVWSLDKPGWKGERVLAGEREYKGCVFFDLREWVKDDSVPTGKGFTVPCEEVRSLAEALMAYADRRDASAPHSGS